MTTVEGYLREHRGDIVCTQCGNCCIDACEAKKETRDGRAICRSHPSITGYQQGSVKDQRHRSPLCCFTPVDIFIRLHVACTPVLEQIQELTGQELNTHHSQRFPGIVRVRSNVVERILQKELQIEK